VNLYVRDGALAGGSGAVLLVVLASRGDLSALLSIRSAAAGIVTALAVEALFLADTRVGELWARPSVQLAGVVIVVGGGLALARVFGPRALAAACWGLATYFGVLAVVVLGRRVRWQGGDSTERDQ